MRTAVVWQQVPAAAFSAYLHDAGVLMPGVHLALPAAGAGAPPSWFEEFLALGLASNRTVRMWRTTVKLERHEVVGYLGPRRGAVAVVSDRDVQVGWCPADELLAACVSGLPPLRAASFAPISVPVNALAPWVGAFNAQRDARQLRRALTGLGLTERVTGLLSTPVTAVRATGQGQVEHDDDPTVPPFVTWVETRNGAYLVAPAEPGHLAIAPADRDSLSRAMIRLLRPPGRGVRGRR